MSVLLVAVLAGAALFALVYGLLGRTKVSSYATSVVSEGSFFVTHAQGWYDRWDRRYRDAGGKPRTPATAGNRVALIVVGVFVSLYLVLGFVPAFFVTVGYVVTQWGFYGFKATRRTKDLEPVLIELVRALASETDYMPAQEAYYVVVKRSREPAIHALLGSSLAMIDSGKSLHQALVSVAKSSSNDAVGEMCAELDAAASSGSASVSAALTQLADSMSEKETVRKEIISGDLFLKVMRVILVGAPLGVMALSVLFSSAAWNNPAGFAVAGFITASCVGINFAVGALTKWRMSY
jgi:hypothetical protein